MSNIEFADGAKCAVCASRPTFVIHSTPGVYRPETDAHMCANHAAGMTENEVRVFTQGWEAGYAAGKRAHNA